MTSNASDLLHLDPEAKGSIRVLVIDDERTFRESCRTFLSTEGYAVEVCGRGTEAQELLKRRPFDIVLIDLYMSEVPGMELLSACLERDTDTIAIMMTGNPSVASSIEALRAGAWDYLTKPFSATQLQILIGRAAHTVLVARESKARHQAESREQGHSDAITVLGVSPAFRRAIELARRVARTDASVFLNGESGTGKELIAQFIHHQSRRSARELVAINCAALPETLLESEMFGHRKGAFTGAVRDKPGLLETANGGTMFLDEVTEMSKPIQAKLLRVIQDGVVRRVGSESPDAVVSVRFISATNRNPEEATASGVLREDLYYRLRVVPITLPPLRERQEDIPLLANHFLKHYWSKHRENGASLPRFSDGAMRALRSHPWRGNVRELQNVIEHAVVLVEPGSEIGGSHLPFLNGDSLPAAPERSSIAVIPTYEEEAYHVARDRVIAEFELRYLTALVHRAAGNMSKAARLAGVDRTTLYRLMEKHGLQRETIMVEGDRA
ncbi:MAG TPA: sigma-54 dependent transcriptional regulator [Gemmatimonadales bacterium]|nr:sigma-54 dependent transcriptional regulator [Gemmatimonadales bacterium]